MKGTAFVQSRLGRHLSGCHVCGERLRERLGRAPSYKAPEHYAKVVTAPEETIRLMAEIDAVIPKWPFE